MCSGIFAMWDLEIGVVEACICTSIIASCVIEFGKGAVNKKWSSLAKL